MFCNVKPFIYIDPKLVVVFSVVVYECVLKVAKIVPEIAYGIP
jgi:hypothetical protein